MGDEASMRAAVVTVSDGVAGGVRADTAGEAVAALLAAHGFTVAERRVVADERREIEPLLRSLADGGARLVVTTGGTGLGPRDVTPEATRAVIEREAPGLAEAMRAIGRASTPMADLSRGVAGTRGATLFLNLPGSEAGATQSLESVVATLPHAVRLLAGHTEHGPGDAGHAAGAVERALTVDDELAARRAAGEAVVIATAIRTEGTPPCRVGQKILLGAGGALAGTLGCAEFDDAAIADAPVFLQEGAPGTRTYLHELGTVEVYLEPYRPAPRLIVLSATPVGRTLLRWGAELGFAPVLVEPRGERLEPGDRARAAVASSLDGLDVGSQDAAVHTDHDAPFVVETLAALLRSPARFVGVMGSARHVGPHLEALAALGFGEGDLARIRTPVGVDVGARSAEEIALSILAGVVAERRGVTPRWLDR